LSIFNLIHIKLKPELEIKLLLEQTLLSDEDYAKSNLLTVTLEGMYALPESWNNPQKEYAYTVSFPVPLNEEVYIILIDQYP